jgi:hypothetical protein
VTHMENQAETQKLLMAALKLPVSERYRLAFLIAESLGYTLKNNIEVILALRKELERGHDLRAKLELQSMRAMDQLRKEIRSLGGIPTI